MEKNITYQHHLLKFLLFFVLQSAVLPATAQSPNFLSGNKTGNIFQSGSLIALGTGNAEVTSPMQEHRTGVFNTLRFYYGDTILSLPGSMPATVTASRVLGLGGLIGSGADAYIQFRTQGNSTISSGVTTYFKIGIPPSITGLSASVGGLLGLSDVYEIAGRGYSGAGNYVLGGSYNENAGTASGLTSGTATRMLIDKDGTWYISVTPDAAYNSVRLNVAFSSSIDLVSLSRDMDVTVYNAFYYSAPPGVDCGTPLFATPGETQGVNLDLGSATQLLALDSAVSDPQNAIDEDTSTYSRITAGALGIASSVSQSFIFHGAGTATDVVKIRLSLPLSALTAGLLSNLNVRAYNGTSQVGPAQSVYSLLSADVLGLLGDNTPFYINVQPGGQFDRISISLDNLASIGSNILGGGVRVYELQRITNAPVISVQPANDTVCAGTAASFSVNVTGDSLSYYWQYHNGNNWLPAGTTNPLYIYNPEHNMNGRRYRLIITGGYCPSARTSYTTDEATLIVHPLPVTPPVTIGQ